MGCLFLNPIGLVLRHARVGGAGPKMLLLLLDAPMLEPDSKLAANSARLLEWFAALEHCAVAFSGGVDSAVVAAAAQRALGSRAVAVTGTSPSLPRGELEQAQELAALIGIRHLVLETREFEQEQYLRNEADRCYHCKSELYGRWAEFAPTLGMQCLVNGANVDDLADYRPGRQAADEHGVRSPLAECGFTKEDVRQLAREWGLPVWDKPAAPCLSSRVVYGEEVTPARLRRIDEAEQFLRHQGFGVVRVRHHPGDLARIEVPVEQLELLTRPALRQRLLDYLLELGFKAVTLDLTGFRSGSLNAFLPVDVLARARRDVSSVPVSGGES